MTETRRWYRRHANGWIGVVQLHRNGRFSGRTVLQGSPVHRLAARGQSITRRQAEALADADGRSKAPHSCGVERCGGWAEGVGQGAAVALLHVED